MTEQFCQQRRSLLKGLSAGFAAPLTAAIPPFFSIASPALAATDDGRQAASLLQRPIPSSGEMIPALGMGTWITFNVGDDRAARAQRLEVLRAFFAAGGGMIDSSPMYGSSEAVVGDCLRKLSADAALPPAFLSATKTWTAFQSGGESQFKSSLRLWGVPKIDVQQIHNLLSWKVHLKTLLKLKEDGLIRYIGITTSHGRRHEDFAAIMRNEPIDFVQFTYNIITRDAESVLLPLAMERKLGVIINRPFEGGGLFNRYGDKPLPPFAAEIGCRHWSQFFLKFILSHPAVTVAIPATSRVDHMRENMAAGLMSHGPLPDETMRAKMVAYVEGL